MNKNNIKNKMKYLTYDIAQYLTLQPQIVDKIKDINLEVVNI